MQPAVSPSSAPQLLQRLHLPQDTSSPLAPVLGALAGRG